MVTQEKTPTPRWFLITVTILATIASATGNLIGLKIFQSQRDKRPVNTMLISPEELENIQANLQNYGTAKFTYHEESYVIVLTK